MFGKTADVGGLMNGVEGLVKIDFEQKQGWGFGWNSCKENDIDEAGCD